MIQITKDVTKFDDKQIANLKEILEKLARQSLNAHGDTMLGDLKLKSNVPASATATGRAGTITWSSTHIYICIAEDTWKRVAISTW